MAIHPLTKLMGSDAERGVGLNAGKGYDERTMCVNSRIELYNWTDDRSILECKISDEIIEYWDECAKNE